MCPTVCYVSCNLKDSAGGGRELLVWLRSQVVWLMCNMEVGELWSFLTLKNKHLRHTQFFLRYTVCLFCFSLETLHKNMKKPFGALGPRSMRLIQKRGICNLKSLKALSTTNTGVHAHIPDAKPDCQGTITSNSLQHSVQIWALCGVIQ